MGRGGARRRCRDDWTQRNLDDLAEATAELWEAHPDLARCVVKLNEGISGEGNAPLELAPLQLAALSAAERRRTLRQALEAIPMPPPQWRDLVVQQGARAPGVGCHQGQ